MQCLGTPETDQVILSVSNQLDEGIVKINHLALDMAALSYICEASGVIFSRYLNAWVGDQERRLKTRHMVMAVFAVETAQSKKIMNMSYVDVIKEGVSICRSITRDKGWLDPSDCEKAGYILSVYRFAHHLLHAEKETEACQALWLGEVVDIFAENRIRLAPSHGDR